MSHVDEECTASDFEELAEELVWILGGIGETWDQAKVATDIDRATFLNYKALAVGQRLASRAIRRMTALIPSPKITDEDKRAAWNWLERALQSDQVDQLRVHAEAVQLRDALKDFLGAQPDEVTAEPPAEDGSSAEDTDNDGTNVGNESPLRRPPVVV